MQRNSISSAASTASALLAMVLVMHNLPWLQHQVWRARTYTERRQRAESAALRQVHKEISDMEHEVGA